MELFVKFALLCTILSSIYCEIYINRGYESEASIVDWLKSGKSEKRSDAGTLELKSKKHSLDENKKSLFTAQNGSFYHYVLPLKKSIANIGKDLVFQYGLTHEEGNSCGGGYLKLLINGDAKTFDGESKYAIMFGPDHCGSMSRIHLIFNIDGKVVLKTQDIPYTVDKKSHIYTLVVRSDKTYQVYVDCKSVSEGKISEDWDYLQPKEIPDQKDTKPTDWVDEAEILDPNDKKPDDWDTDEFIIDSNSTKPEGWNDEIDGQFEFNKIKNPLYKGIWAQKKIANPDYKGQWAAKNIPNPDYKENVNAVEYDNIDSIGLDIWQVDAHSHISHISLGNDLPEILAECKAVQADFEEYNKIIQKHLDEEEKLQKEQMQKMQKEAAKNAPPPSDENDEDKDDDKDDIDLEQANSGAYGDEL